ncbi:MAG: heme exporter protein CcmD [Pseudomonadota bacterium]
MEVLPDFDKNAAYIWAVYVLSGLIIGGLALWTGLRAKAAKSALSKARPPEDQIP